MKQPSRKEVPDPRKYYNRKGFFAISAQAAVGADYKVLFLSTKHAGFTHDSTAFSSTTLAQYLEKVEAHGGMPNWASVAADEAYPKKGRVITPFSGRALPVWKDSFNFYLSSALIFVEQAFGMIVGRWGVFWPPMKCDLKKATLIIQVCCKLHNFIIDRESTIFETPHQDEENYIEGSPTVWIQDELALTEEHRRGIRRD